MAKRDGGNAASDIGVPLSLGQRHVPIELGVTRPIHLSHAALLRRCVLLVGNCREPLPSAPAVFAAYTSKVRLGWLD